MQNLRLLGFFAVISLAACSHVEAPALQWQLTGTVWKVSELEGAMIAAAKIPTLQLEPNGNRIVAFGGVNRYTGTYVTSGDALTFSALASTKMSGPADQMKVEEKFIRILGTVDHWEYKSPWLTLKSGEKIVARANPFPATPFVASTTPSTTQIP